MNLVHMNSKCLSSRMMFVWLLAGSISLLCAGSAPAANRTWTGGGADNNWNTATNWGGTAPVASDLLFFDGTTRLTNTNNIAANTAFNGITFNSTAGAFTLCGNALKLGGGVTNNCLTNGETISLNMALTATGTFDVVSGSTLSIGGVISGNSYGVTKVDAGMLTLSGTNTFSGVATVLAGTLEVQKDGGFGQRHQRQRRHGRNADTRLGHFQQLHERRRHSLADQHRRGESCFHRLGHGRQPLYQRRAQVRRDLGRHRFRGHQY